MAKELDVLQFRADELGISPEKGLALNTVAHLTSARLEKPYEISRRFAEAVGSLRTERDLSREKVAVQSGLTLHRYTRIERGRTRPTLVEACHVAKALEMSTAELVGLAGL